jgi:hypothetical protein
MSIFSTTTKKDGNKVVDELGKENVQFSPVDVSFIEKA